MARPIDPISQYRVKSHVANGHAYASTQPSYVDSKTGKKKYRHFHWGTIDNNNKFIPGTAFYLSAPEERNKLIFPDGWDLSEIQKFSGLNVAMGTASDGDYQNLLYGDIWLLEQVAQKTGVVQDLLAVFDGNQEIVDDILTIAIFPYLTKYTYNRLARWQRIVRAPSSRILSSTEITRLTQSITERHRMDFLKLRAARIEKDELCAVDSTTRTAYGDSLADIRWGKNKENLPFPQTMEVVVYTLSNHMPLYYRTFPGNMPDTRSVDVILADLDHAGFKDLILITDRGYDSQFILDKYIQRGQAMIMCVKIGQDNIVKKIQAFGDFIDYPEGMRIDPETKLYFRQYDLDSEITTTGQSTDRLKLNLYFDPIRRSYELLDLNIAIAQQENALNELSNNKSVMDSDGAIKRNFCYYKVTYDSHTRIIQSYKLNDAKIAKARRLSGFFANMTHKLDYDAISALRIYRLRDEQEKYFQQMKDQLVSDRQRNWSEDGKTGRLFILFVALILSSFVRHVWKSSKLHNVFSSSLEILDEMKPIRYIERSGSDKKTITPFIGKQIDICEVFGIDIPAGCAPPSKPTQLPKQKRGRPPKKKVE